MAVKRPAVNHRRKGSTFGLEAMLPFSFKHAMILPVKVIIPTMMERYMAIACTHSSASLRGRMRMLYSTAYVASGSK